MSSHRIRTAPAAFRRSPRRYRPRFDLTAASSDLARWHAAHPCSRDLGLLINLCALELGLLDRSFIARLPGDPPASPSCAPLPVSGAVSA